MSHEEEKSFPKELTNKAFIQGDVWGWKLRDISEVVHACREFNLAIFAGSFIVFLPQGIFDVYWLGAYPKTKMITESWAQYVERSCSEFDEFFNELMKKVNLEEEVTRIDAFIKEDWDGVNVMDCLYFELDIKSETHYLEFISKYTQ